MIKVKTAHKLKNFEGELLKNGDEDLTIGTVISTVLGGQVSNPALGWVLGKKFATQKEVELKAEEVVFIKEELKSQKQWFAVVVGQVLELLDGDETKE